MAKKTQKQNTPSIIERPPIIVVMGHIDHGKSTLLDYIRKSNVVEGEAGGITQHTSAYEVIHTAKDGSEKKITFLDTPGHEAFQSMRSRGAKVADIAILVVAADDGVKEQTKEAMKAIQEAGIPFIVAINKIDKPNADVNKTISTLIEHEIYLEGYGGNTSYAQISAKQGQNVDELLDLILLTAEVEELRADSNAPAEGVIIETNVDPKKGISATLVIKSGTMKSGQYIQAGTSLSPVRIMEDFAGKKISEATFSSPVRITGFDSVPIVGTRFQTFNSRKEAEVSLTEAKETESIRNESGDAEEVAPVFTIPLIVKTDVAGTADAIRYEVQKLSSEKGKFQILESGLGDVTEGDVRRVVSTGEGVVVGFNVKIEGTAREVAERLNVKVESFSIIYELTEWLTNLLESLRPRIQIKELTGSAKILKTFNREKDRQIIGGKVLDGSITKGSECIIRRREDEIGKGHIVGLQQMKTETTEVQAGNEFGMRIESRFELAPGDVLEVFRTREE